MRPLSRAGAALALGLAVLLVAATGWRCSSDPPEPALAPAPPAPPSADQLDDRIGIAVGGVVQTYDDERLTQQLDDIERLGAAWLRVDVGWSSVERRRGVFDWTRPDRVIEGGLERGLAIVATVGYTPDWAREPVCADTDKCEPADPGEFAAFAEAVAERYAPRGVLVYEVWNEPNSSSFWAPRAHPEKYAELLRRTYPLLKAVDPAIQVLAGATAPAGAVGEPGCDGVETLHREDGSMNPVDFVRLLYEHGAQGRFDALSHHPYSDTGFDEHPCSAWHQLDATEPSLRSLMEANGDGEKLIWATEYGVDASRHGPEGTAEQLAEALDRWLALPWAGALLYYTYQDDACCEGYWLVERDGARRPAWEAYRRHPKG